MNNPLKIRDDDTKLADVEEIKRRAVGDPIPEINTIDPGLSVYSFDDMPAAVEFAKVMSQAGPMLPKHAQGNPGVCLAIIYRARHWGIDPFGLAMESYQVKADAPVAYQASVFATVLINNGIYLDYEYSGETHFTAEAAKSAKGNQVATGTAAGTRQLTVSCELNGKTRSYTTPMLKDIKVKNSPLWHNDPDQQLGYYAVRAWARRYRPDLMMGALSVEDVRDTSVMRDVSPKREPGGFSKMVAQARAERSAPDQSETLGPNQDENDIDGQAEEEQSEPDPDESSPEFQNGVAAGEGGLSRGDCPYTEDRTKALNWLAGWDSTLPEEEQDGDDAEGGEE